MTQKENFPTLLFTVYFIYFAGQAIQNGYQSLFLTQNGFSPSEIGITTFVTALFILFMQTGFGYISDHTRIKNYSIYLLYAGALLTSLLLCLVPHSLFSVLILLSLFSGFFSSLVPMTDNFTTSFMSRNSKYDYGSVRMGGTIGYAFMMLISGYILNDNYRHIFMIIALSLFLGFLCFLFLPKNTGSQPQISSSETDNRIKHGFFQIILNNRVFLMLILFSLLLSVGENLYSSYYPIYYLTIGGNSRLIGIMQFINAISEIPCLFFIGRIVRKYGVGKTLSVSAALACLRWLLLYLITDPTISIFAGLLHGFTFSCSNYCMVNYIFQHMDAQVQASSQVFKNTVSMIFSRAIFGYLGGLLYESFQPRFLLLVSASFAGTAAILMLLWGRNKEAALKI